MTDVRIETGATADIPGFVRAFRSVIKTLCEPRPMRREDMLYPDGNPPVDGVEVLNYVDGGEKAKGHRLLAFRYITQDGFEMVVHMDCTYVFQANSARAKRYVDEKIVGIAAHLKCARDERDRALHPIIRLSGPTPMPPESMARNAIAHVLGKTVH